MRIDTDWCGVGPRLKPSSLKFQDTLSSWLHQKRFIKCFHSDSNGAKWQKVRPLPSRRTLEAAAPVEASRALCWFSFGGWVVYCTSHPFSQTPSHEPACKQLRLEWKNKTKQQLTKTSEWAIPTHTFSYKSKHGWRNDKQLPFHFMLTTFASLRGWFLYRRQHEAQKELITFPDVLFFFFFAKVTF